MYLCNWWRLTKRRVHEREVELAFSGQRVAAEGHGDLLHRDLEAGRRERLDKDMGAEAEWVGRMDGCLSHLRIGSSLIDLQGYETPGGRKLHAGGQGLPADAPEPEIDPTKGTLDHFAINLAPYDPEAVTAYLADKGHAPYAQGQRYGADGDGYSIYLKDPEGTVVELKSGN